MKKILEPMKLQIHIHILDQMENGHFLLGDIYLVRI